MSFERLDFAYHRGIDNKFTYRLRWAQILLILCKRPNKVYIVKMLKHQTQTGFGAKMGSMRSAFDIYTKFLDICGAVVCSGMLVCCSCSTCRRLSDLDHNPSQVFTAYRFPRRMHLKTTRIPRWHAR